jgi:hypothetical protein
MTENLIRYIRNQLRIYKFTDFANPKTRDDYERKLAIKILNKVQKGAAYPERAAKRIISKIIKKGEGDDS